MKDKPGEEFEDEDDTVDSLAFNLRVQREDQQKEIFTKWINNWFAYAKSESRIDDLYFNFSDGILLGELLSIVTKGQFSQKCDNVNNRIVHILNVRVCLNYLNTKYPGFDDLDAVDIVDQKHNFILKLIWQLLLIFPEPPVDEGKEKGETDYDKKDMSSDSDFEHLDPDRESIEGNVLPDKNNNIEDVTIDKIDLGITGEMYPKYGNPGTDLIIDSQSTEDEKNNVENEVPEKEFTEIENVEELLSMMKGYNDDKEKDCDLIEQGSKESTEKSCTDMEQTERGKDIKKRKIDTPETKTASSPSSSEIEISQSNSNSVREPSMREEPQEMRNRDRLKLALIILAIVLVCAQKCWTTLYDYISLD